MIKRIILADTADELDAMYSADVQRADRVLVRCTDCPSGNWCEPEDTNDCNPLGYWLEPLL